MTVTLTLVRADQYAPGVVEVRVDWTPPNLFPDEAPQALEIWWGGGYVETFQITAYSGTIYDGHSYGSAGTYEIFARTHWVSAEFGSFYEESNHIFVTLQQQPVPPPPQLPPTQPPILIEPPWGPPTERPLEPPLEEPPLRPEPPKPLPPDRPPSPRMSIDVHIWNAFVGRFGDRISRWALEVPLDYGDVHEMQNVPDQYKSMWQRLTQHKADCVVEISRVIYVCEIKPRLTLAALGQAYFGWQLFQRRYKTDRVTKPAVICATAPMSLLQIASQNGITVFVVEEVTSSVGVKEWIE